MSTNVTLSPAGWFKAEGSRSVLYCFTTAGVGWVVWGYYRYSYIFKEEKERGFF